ncbi:hypothetical protein HDK77DRAFT_482265 [Phyllosticta capitalensis]|uniref:Fatty acid hydroxylase n=1 Tax=Phyllosticta capitalensis TaxID=121624 RepID=A0ABR1YML7_9PEZI
MSNPNSFAPMSDRNDDNIFELAFDQFFVLVHTHPNFFWWDITAPLVLGWVLVNYFPHQSWSVGLLEFAYLAYWFIYYNAD